MKLLNSTENLILQVIAHSSEEEKYLTLEELISVGDMINHSIFTPGELQNGLYKLIKNDYIRMKDKSFSLSEKSYEIIKPILKKNYSLMKEREKLAIKFKAESWNPNQEIPPYDETLDPVIFSIAEFNKARNSYHKKAWKIINKLLKK
jgi:hypothetical protein